MLSNQISVCQSALHSLTHSIIYTQTSSHAPSRTIDIQPHGLLCVLRFEEKKLSGQERGRDVVDWSKEDDSFTKETRIDVVGTFASGLKNVER